MEYLTIAFRRQVLNLAVDDYGRVTIVHQHPMTDEEEDRADKTGHTPSGITQLGA